MDQPLGQKLKTAREQQSLSLLDASHATKIPVQLLHFLETNNLAGFGNSTYARAFLRRYSEFLNVNAEDMLDGLADGALGGPRDYRYLTENHGSWVTLRGESQDRLSNGPNKQHTRKSPLPAGLCIFFLVLVGTGIWGQYVSGDRLSTSQQMIEVKEFPPLLPIAKALLPKPAIMQENQATTLITHTQVFRTPEPTSKVVTVDQIASDEIEKLNENPAGKTEFAE